MINTWKAISRPLRTKPSPDTGQFIVNWAISNTFQDILITIPNDRSRKCISKCRLKNVAYFVYTLMCLSKEVSIKWCWFCRLHCPSDEISFVKFDLTLCRPVVPYGYIDICQQWLRQWLVARRHQAVTSIRVNDLSVRSCVIHLKVVSQEDIHPWYEFENHNI